MEERSRKGGPDRWVDPDCVQDLMFAKAIDRVDANCYKHLKTCKPVLDGMYNPDYGLVEPRVLESNFNVQAKTQTRQKRPKVPACLQKME